MKWYRGLYLFPGLLLWNEYICSLGIVKGTSMHPTLNPPASSTHPSIKPSHDIVLISKWIKSFPSSLKMGDVVFFTHPFDPKKTLVKRIVALQGDSIRFNGLDELDSRWNDPSESLDSLDKHYLPKNEWIKIPQGHVWVESDSSGTDSLNFGPIPMGLIQGKVSAIVYPFDRFLYPVDVSFTRAQSENRFRKGWNFT